VPRVVTSAPGLLQSLVRPPELARVVGEAHSMPSYIDHILLAAKLGLLETIHPC
jgi:hypothetical protein